MEFVGQKIFVAQVLRSVSRLAPYCSNEPHLACTGRSLVTPQSESVQVPSKVPREIRKRACGKSIDSASTVQRDMSKRARGTSVDIASKVRREISKRACGKTIDNASKVQREIRK